MLLMGMKKTGIRVELCIQVIIIEISVLADLETPVITGDNRKRILIIQDPKC